MTRPRPKSPGSVHDMLGEAFDIATRAAVREALRVGKSTVSGWEDEDETNGRRMSVVDLDRMAEHFPDASAVVARRYARFARGSFVPDDDETPTVSAACASLTRAVGEAVAKIVEARDPDSDGGSEVTPAEREEALRFVQQVIAEARHAEAALHRLGSADG